MRARDARHALWLGALLLAGCAAPRVEVVLLPQDDGSTSAVQVTSGGSTEQLSKPYERFTAAVGQKPRIDQADPAELAKQYGEVLALRPPKPERFVLYFDVGSAALSEASQRTTAALFQAASQRPGADIMVIGHTDTIGSATSNDQLSQQRAEEMRTTLMQRQLFVLHQVPNERIEAVGRGEREPAVPTTDEVAEPRNRRVEILLR
jgi:outer membrane protein OmpA-like peptidoglycan-associated protein